MYFRARKPVQNLDMYAPPDGTGTAARRLVDPTCYAILYEIRNLSHLNDELSCM